MGEISSELKKFKNSVSPPSIEKMQYDLNKLQTIVSDFQKLNEEAKNGIDKYYSSSKKSKIIDSLNSIDEECNNLNNNISVNLKEILSSCNSLLDSIKNLETINDSIADQKSILNKVGATESEISQAKIYIEKKEKEFDEEESKAETALNNLKGIYLSTLPIATQSIFETPIGSSFKMEEFDVNGTKIKCLVYVPTYSKAVGKLPVMMYMNGANFNSDAAMGSMTANGLGKLIKDGDATPTGIVVIPYVKNGKLYEDKNYRDALAQLPLDVANKYNGDVERISLAGTSYGAITAYRLVNENPGRYSAIIAVCGAENVTSAFKGMTVYNYTNNDTSGNHTSCNYIEDQNEAIQNIGGYATLIKYNNQSSHGNVGNSAFSEYVEDENGNKIPIYELIFRYKRKSNTEN